MAHIIRFDEGYRFDAGWYWGQLVPDGLPKKGNMTDYIPKNWADYRAWLQNMKTEIDTEGPKFGLTAGAITAIKNTCQAEMDKIDAYNAALSAADAALEDVKDGRALTDTALQEEIGDWKKATG